MLAKGILRYFIFSNSSSSLCLHFFYTLSATRVLNSYEELCITLGTADNSFARVLNPHGGAYIYIYISSSSCHAASKDSPKLRFILWTNKGVDSYRLVIDLIEDRSIRYIYIILSFEVFLKKEFSILVIDVMYDFRSKSSEPQLDFKFVTHLSPLYEPRL